MIIENYALQNYLHKRAKFISNWFIVSSSSYLTCQAVNVYLALAENEQGRCAVPYPTEVLVVAQSTNMAGFRFCEWRFQFSPVKGDKGL